MSDTKGAAWIGSVYETKGGLLVVHTYRDVRGKSGHRIVGTPLG